MSRHEYNKGKLLPTDHTFETLASELGCNNDGYWMGYSDAEDYCLDNCYGSGYEIICGKIYKVVFEVEAGDLDELCMVSKLPDGSIEFETYHYNGGAHWTELVEYQL